MPYKEEMTWEPAKKRWAKMYKRQRYFVVASSLGDPPTRENTRAAANDWWIRKRAELDGQTQPLKKMEDVIVDGLHEDLTSGKTTFEAVRESAVFMELEDRFLAPIIEQGVKTFTEARAKDLNRSVKATAERFLDLAKGDMKPLSFRELRQYVQSLYADKGPLKPDHDVNVITEDKVESVYLKLRNGDLSSGAKKKRWGFFRRYVRYLWGKRLIDLPRNLDSHSFEVKAKKIKTFTVREVKDCLDALKPRLKLYALLGLNCGMTSADTGQLAKGMIDLDKGTLTRRRVKTGDNDNVPTVTYKLWPEVVQLLRDCWSEHPTLALTSMDNTPLWESRQEGDATPQKDLIYQQFKRAGAKISIKHFRSIAASTIEKHETYGRYAAHFLGHSPKSIAEKHYVAPSQELFDRCLSWLHGQIFRS